jgi:hypothetical protein
MPYLSILIVACFGAFFYRAAEFENESGLLWCSLSVLISIAVMFFLHWGLLGVVLGQVGLFVAITLFRIARKP